jgi:hypothetical protein
MEISHSKLVEISAKWLQSRYPVVITEMLHGESYDAVGFGFAHGGGGCSTTIECKTSIADFKADAKKMSRRLPEYLIGSYRYYFTPSNIDISGMLPEGWGLLVLRKSRVYVAVKAPLVVPNHQQEISLLVSAIRRIGNSCPKSISVKCYTYETKCRATLGVELISEKEKMGKEA